MSNWVSCVEIAQIGQVQSVRLHASWKFKQFPLSRKVIYFQKRTSIVFAACGTVIGNVTFYLNTSQSRARSDMSLRLPFFVAIVDLDKYVSVTLPYLALASLNLLQLWAICWQHQSISIEPKTTPIVACNMATQDDYRGADPYFNHNLWFLPRY